MRHPSIDSERSSLSYSTLRALALAAALPLAALTGCSTTDVKVWNLEQLHDGDSRHRYQADLQGDIGWFWRRQFLGLFQGAAAQYVAQTDAEAIENPSSECLENLIALQERARNEEEPDPRHIEWFARLAVEDKSGMSRERAVLALADLGARLPVGLPARLGADQKPAGPAELAPVLEELVRAVRVRIETSDGRSKSDDLRSDAAKADARMLAEQQVVKSCAAVRALDLDLAACRRALRASAELERAVQRADVEAPAVTELTRHLESLCVRRALAAAIEDKDDWVRAAAIRGIARTGGARAFDAVLYTQFRTERSPRPLRSTLEVLAEYGLPRAEPGGRALTHTDEEWIESVKRLAIEHRDGALRVRAMHTLQAIAAPEVQSLREEDWYRWWLARKAEQNGLKNGLKNGLENGSTGSTPSANTPTADPSGPAP